MPTKYATVDVRRNLRKSLAAIEECKANPTAWNKVVDKEAYLSDEKRIRKTLSDVTPPDSSGTEKDKIKTRLDGLKEALVHGNAEVPRMPSRRRLWENDAGAASDLLRWEHYWGDHTLDEKGAPVKVERGKGAKWEAKDLMRIHGKDHEDEDGDVANLERIRPADDAAPLMDVPRRSYGLSSQAKANYDAALPDHPPTSVEARLAARAPSDAAVLRQIKKERAKQRSDMMKARWAAKKAAGETPKQPEDAA